MSAIKPCFLSLVLTALVLMFVSCTTVNEEAGLVEPAVREDEKAVEGIMDDLGVDMSGLSLYDTYDDLGIMIGTDLNGTYVDDPWCRDIMGSQFNLFTPIYELKPYKILDQELSQKNGRLTIVFSDEMIKCFQWCKDNGKKIHGHTMFWWKTTPDWIFREGFRDDGAYLTREALLERMENYVKDTFAALEEGGWMELFYCYDIYNEFLDIKGEKPNESPWVSIIGDDVIFYAFKFARKYAPSYVKLVYNENYCENSVEKRDATIDLVKRLVDENGNPLIDCLGLQCHITLSNKIDSLCDNIRYIAENIGDVKIQVTELDCAFMVNPKTVQERLKKQGTYYYTLMNTLLEIHRSLGNIDAVTVWGFRDDICWLSENAAVLYDLAGTPKYSYFGMLQMREYSGFED